MKNKLANVSGKGDWKREYFSIPNLMGYFRILLVPVFIALYLRAESYRDYLIASLVLGVSALTDLFDGKVARRFNMVTEWGKFVDPVADKLTQAATAICLTTRYPMMMAVAAVLVCKELTLLVLGAIFLHFDKKMDGAAWCGKIATVVVDVSMIILLLAPELSYTFANVLMYLCIGFMIYALVGYCLIYHNLWLDRASPKEKKKHKWWKGILSGAVVLMLFLTYEVVGMTVPNASEPEVSEAYQASFSTADYYGDGTGDDAARLISDNGEARDVRLALIAGAEERVILTCFEIHSDRASLEILAALYAAAERGVQVSLLVDGMPAFIQMEGNPYFYALSTHENAEVRVYNPVNFLKPWKLMSRMHDKFLIIDEDYYLIGGRNPYNTFLGDYSDVHSSDWDVLVCHESGEAFGELEDYFTELWVSEDVDTFADAAFLRYLPSVKEAIAELTEIDAACREADPQLYDGSWDASAGAVATDKITFLSGQTEVGVKEPEVFYALVQLMEEAEEDVTIHTPYYVSNDALDAALSSLTSGGADVRLLTNSLASASNLFGAAFYRVDRARLLELGVTVLEHDGGSNHGKAIAVDDDLSMVGSFNMNPRSVYLDTETMLVIDSEEFNATLRASMEADAATTVTVGSDGSSEALSPAREAALRLTYALFRWVRFLI